MINAAFIKEHQDREGMLRRSLERIIQLYKDKVHFVYELLQNAEDAQARVVKFVLYEDRLEVFHDGKPFTESNVQSLFDIGLSDKVNDLNQIGEFGVGFKSVFSICERVQFFSNPNNYRIKDIENAGSFGFEIQDFYKPVDIPIVDIGTVYTTKFIFPFAVDKSFLGFKKMEDLRSKIKEKLENLSETTLLFMKNIEIIEYEINLSNEFKAGNYMLDKKKINDHCYCVKALSEGQEAKDTQKNTQEISYIVFSRKLDKGRSDRSVDIAFSYTEKNEEWQFVPATEKHIFVYFPTGTESKLNFIVQGPYRTTPSRSEIPMDDPENISLATETADLLYNSVLELREMGKLNLSLLNVLPIEEKNFYSIFREVNNVYSSREWRKSNNLLSALYDRTVKLFKQEQILPCRLGGFTDAMHARLLRSHELAEVFDDETLTLLLKENEPVHWLPEEITDNSQIFQTLYKYLNSSLGIRRLSPDDIPRLLESNLGFLPAKKDNVVWLTKFYSFLSSVPAQFNQVRNGAMLLVSFILTDKGNFVAPFRKAENRYYQNVFISFDEDDYKKSDLEFIEPQIYDKCREFFDGILRLEKPNEYDSWVKGLKKRLESASKVSVEQHIKDIKKIVTYLKHPDYAEDLKGILRTDLKLKCFNKTGTVWCCPYSYDTIYFAVNSDGIKIQEYFRNIIDCNFVDFDFYNNYEINYDDLILLNVCGDITEERYGTSGEYENGKPGTNPKWETKGSFRWGWTIKKLAEVLYYIETNPQAPDARIKSSIVFQLLLANQNNLIGNVNIKGETDDLIDTPVQAIALILKKRWNTGVYDYKYRYPENFREKWNFSWLFTNEGRLVASTEISKYDLSRELYGDVRLDSNLYEILKFKKDNRDIAEQIFKDYNSLSVERRDAYGSQWLKECFGITPEQLTHILDSNDEDGSNEFFNFPIDDVGNWESVERHAEQMFAYAEPVLYAEKVRSIRISKNGAAVKTYLQQAYRLMGNRDLFACQLCHQTFANIEICQLDEKGDADKELEPMHLCLCPNCAVEFRAYRNSSAYSDFQNKLRSLNREEIKKDSPVKVPLADKEVWFTQRHIAEIVLLLQMKKSVQKDN